MIHTSRTVTVGKTESIINEPIVLYRGDREVEVEFAIVGSKFTFTNGGNVIKSTNATHGQLVVDTPTGENMFSEVTECHEGKVVFTITKEMIDELAEVGLYSFQIRLFDESQVSRVTIPPVYQGIEIRHPMAAEDETDLVDIGLVDYSVVRKNDYENVATFLPNGDYNKTNWEEHDVISRDRLNKVEDALYKINKSTEGLYPTFQNQYDEFSAKVNKDVKAYKEEMEDEVEQFERDMTQAFGEFKVDTNAAMTEHKNEVSEIINDIDAFVHSNISWVNIKDFGAKGDGITNDTAAFKEAIYNSPNGSTIIIPSGTYLVCNVGQYAARKNITLKGYGNPTVKLNPNVTSKTVLGNFSGSYTVRDHYVSINLGNDCQVKTHTLKNGNIYYYFVVSDATVIPDNFERDSLIRGANSKTEAYIAYVDKSGLDGENTARIYLFETHNTVYRYPSFKTSSDILTEEIQLVPGSILDERYVITFTDTIPSFLTSNTKLTQKNGKSCRINHVDNDKKQIVVDSVNSETDIFNVTVPLIDNEDFTVESYKVSSTTFINCNRWEHCVIDGITFDGSNYEVGYKQSSGNNCNIILTGGCNDLTIRDCVFKNSIMAGLQISGVCNVYSPTHHDLPTNVLVDNCTFFNNGRGDIEIIFGNNISITNCVGNGILDIEANNTEITDNIYMTNCSFGTTTPYIPNGQNSSSSVHYTDCDFHRFICQDAVNLYLTSCSIHHFAPYNCNVNLYNVNVNVFGSNVSFHGNERVNMVGGSILQMYTTKPAAKNGSEDVKLNNVVIDLSISPDLSFVTKHITIRDSIIYSKYRKVYLPYSSKTGSTLDNVTIEGVDIHESKSSINPGWTYTNCKFIDPLRTSIRTGGRMFNCYIECDLSALYNDIHLYNCIMSYDSKPKISGHGAISIHGLCDDKGNGIDWTWTTVGTNIESTKLRFHNVWLSDKVPEFLGIGRGRYAVGVDTVMKNSTVFWTDSDENFSSKVAYADNQLTMRHNI